VNDHETEHAMMRIDAHQHFWKFDPVRDSWINDHMTRLRRDFLPHDLEPVLARNNVEGTIVVQSDQSEKENEFQLLHAAGHDFIKGVVGWVDLTRADIRDALQRYAGIDKFKGFRHILQSETDRAYMLSKGFRNGIRNLREFGFTYDILILPDQLPHVTQLVRLFPDQPFVLDHIGKPDIARQDISLWTKEIKELAACENVYCKISGMVTEAKWNTWQPGDFKPYLDIVVENFGTKRILFGSDWPVCLLSASYEETIGIVEEYFKNFSADEQAMFFGLNAIKFYRI
jgi:L-fuconolactonase